MSYNDDYDPDYIASQLVNQDNTNRSMQNAYRSYGKKAVVVFIEESVSLFVGRLAEKAGVSKPLATGLKYLAKQVTKSIFHQFKWFS